VLALEKRVIPPNIFFDTPNPKIPLEAANFRVPVEATPWPVSHSERASVNSFGIGGANAHVVLESAAFYGINPMPNPAANSRPQLLLFSSHDQKVLQESIQAHEDYAEIHPKRVEDLAYTITHRRAHMAYRAFVVKSNATPVQNSSSVKAKQIAQFVFIFTGQGAQWAQMGKELIRDFPSFSQDLERMQDVLARVPHPPSWRILG